MTEPTPLYNELISTARFVEMAQFPWNEVVGDTPADWQLYVPTLREQIVDLSGRTDYTTYTAEHAEKLTVMLGENLLGLHDDPNENPVEGYSTGSDGD